MTTSAPVSAAGKEAGRFPAVLGLDIGGTKIAAGVVDGSGRVHSFLVAPTEAARGPDDGLERLFALGRRAIDAAGVDGEVAAVAIGCGGPLDGRRGVLVSPLHLPGWRDVPVVELAERAFDRPASLENDATAAAAGEFHFGAGAGTRHMVYLTISTGIGGGVVVDGRLYRGARGNGGELGHVSVDLAGRICPGCGAAGCLEAYASGTAIAQRAREAGLGEVTAADVAASARAGDAVAEAVWDEAVEALACGVTSIVNVFEPEVVVLGGGVSRAGEQLLGPVRERVRTSAVSAGGRASGVVQAALGEHVGVVGAAAVAYEEAAAGALVLQR